MKPRVIIAIMVAAVASNVGCGGSQKPARGAGDANDDLDNPTAASEVADSKDDVDQPELAKNEGDTGREHDGPRKKMTNDTDNPKNNPDLEFKEGGSVDDAIKAVPQGLPRENMEQEVLDKPLLDTSLYAVCKLSPANHFEINFAVWNGKVVGMDIKSTPKNAKLEACVRDAAMKATWREKTKSLNISKVMF